jgi:hypothetical protein
MLALLHRTVTSEGARFPNIPRAFAPFAVEHCTLRSYSRVQYLVSRGGEAEVGMEVGTLWQTLPTLRAPDRMCKQS